MVVVVVVVVVCFVFFKYLLSLLFSFLFSPSSFRELLVRFLKLAGKRKRLLCRLQTKKSRYLATLFCRSLIIRLAYKSSLESAKRDRQSSSERARSASERELDLFPLLEIESSDVILARTFQGAKLSNCQLNAFLSFQSFQRISENADNCIGKLSQCVSKRW